MVTLPLLSTAYSPGLIWRSAAFTSFNWLTFTASVLFVPAFTFVIALLPALIPSLVTLGPLVIVKPSLLMLKLLSPNLIEPASVKLISLDNWTFNLPSLLFTPMLFSVNLVLSAPPTISTFWLSFFAITLESSVWPSSPANFKPSSIVATSRTISLPSLPLIGLPSLSFGV